MILTEKELIQIRRHLHQIPELALKEFKTHDYLLNTIRGFNQDYLKIEVPQSLPTAILVLVKGKILKELLVIAQILMLYLLMKKLIFRMLLKILM